MKATLSVFVFLILLSAVSCKKTMAPPLPSDAKPEVEELWLNRFLGLEIYHIETAEWNLYEDDGRMNFWISLDCDNALKQFEDTEYTNTIPNWELNLIEEEIEISEGFNALIPVGYDESRRGWITNFYAGSHEGSDKNTIKIVEIDGDNLLLRLSGEVIDPNFYDDSKPRTQLLVETWFTKNGEGGRSMQ